MDSGIIIEQRYDDLIKAGLDDNYPTPSNNVVQHDFKVTMDHEGEFHKGYIYFYPDLGFQLDVPRNTHSSKIDLSVSFQHFKQNWTTLLGKDIIFPGHFTSRLLLRLSTTSENAPSLNYISGKNLLSSLPPSLFKVLNPSNLDRQVWLDSYHEEKQGLIDHTVYDKVYKSQYMDLNRAGKITKAIPSL